MHLLILGASSDIGIAIAHKFARAEGAHICLASRNLGLLEKKARDIETRYQVKAKAIGFDATDYAGHPDFYRNLDPKPDAVVFTAGYQGNQGLAQKDFGEMRKIIETNFLGAASILEIIAADFEAKGRGLIIGISSVAGERGRQSNYLYGASKSAMTTFLGGLRNRLHPGHVRVMTVLPGFVRTRMTAGMKLPQLLVIEPEQVAEDVYRAYQAGKDIVYTGWFWRWLMGIIRNIPEAIFKRLKL
ncbi:MAG: SDR family oxidoreductase [Deltaproteobacteria bacterium]|nr:SDR family oxidoreductase [Deltaproteobacteria bacterium]